MLNLLQKEDNLTLSFDGGSTQHPELFYIAHVTMQEQTSFFLHGHTGSSDSHNTKWIMDKLIKVMITSVCSNMSLIAVTDSPRS